MKFTSSLKLRQEFSIQSSSIFIVYTDVLRTHPDFVSSCGVSMLPLRLSSTFTSTLGLGVVIFVIFCRVIQVIFLKFCVFRWRKSLSQFFCVDVAFLTVNEIPIRSCLRSRTI